MKFSLWTQYGALNSKPVFDAFRQGAHALGFTTVDNSSNADIDVIWSVLFNGRMAGNKAIWEKNIRTSKPTIVLEVGGIQRGTTWKVGLNGINRDAYFGPNNNSSERANLLGLNLKPWNISGNCILICGQHEKSLQWYNMPSMSQWVMNTIDSLQQHTSRHIIFRSHPRCVLPYIEHEFKNVSRQVPKKLIDTYDDYDMQFNDVYATVSWSSNPGIHSILQGIPAFVGPSSLAYDVANKDLSQIENPVTPDRQQWLNDYAHTEWTISEISQGIPLKRLTSKL
jgi:hypothetical protein